MLYALYHYKNFFLYGKVRLWGSGRGIKIHLLEDKTKTMWHLAGSSVDYVTLALGVMSSNPTLCIKITLKTKTKMEAMRISKFSECDERKDGKGQSLKGYP